MENLLAVYINGEDGDPEFKCLSPLKENQRIKEALAKSVDDLPRGIELEISASHRGRINIVQERAGNKTIVGHYLLVPPALKAVAEEFEKFFERVTEHGCRLYASSALEKLLTYRVAAL